jgi:hypothetical protein
MAGKAPSFWHGGDGGTLVPQTDFEPYVADAAFRTAPDAEREYWERQARAAIHREVLTAEGVDAPVPNAMNTGSTINSGVYVGWYPNVDCGGFGDELVSGDCGTFDYTLIHLDCGVF